MAKPAVSKAETIGVSMPLPATKESVTIIGFLRPSCLSTVGRETEALAPNTRDCGRLTETTGAGSCTSFFWRFVAGDGITEAREELPIVFLDSLQSPKSRVTRREPCVAAAWPMCNLPKRCILQPIALDDF